MKVLKCPFCGGDIEINEEVTIGICKYCDSQIPIPKKFEKNSNLYNRAVFFRQNNEFDKAISLYEKILEEDNENAEAHWGLVLSKYGIEYVVDPKTDKRIPTCHRMCTTSILSDIDYSAALEYSDDKAKIFYVNEANKINKIQLKILEISKHEPVYDIFLCYKELDDVGNRSEDSVLAQEIYYMLTQKGYKVFFARKTLESKLGEEYEPYIFAALNNAKIMIVICTNEANLHAVWVKNEWSRFRKLSLESPEKVIIPAYKGMSAYELPADLAALQSLDMSKIGFMQDLIDGIEKIMKKSKIESINIIKNTSILDSLESLIKNGNTYLKLKNYTSAEEVYIKITKNYPEDYRGWWGLIVCETKNFTTFDRNQEKTNLWFNYIIQLAEDKKIEKLKKIYIGYTAEISKLEIPEELQRLDELIESYQQDISNYLNEEEQLQKTISYQKDLIDKSEEDRDNLIDSSNRSLKDFKIRKSILFFRIAIGVCFIMLARWMGTDEFRAPALVILFTLLVGILIIFFAVKNPNFIKKCKEENDDNHKRIIIAKENCKKKIQEFEEQIAICKEDIIKINVLKEKREKQIETAKNLKEMGNDRMFALLYKIRCEQFGVLQPIDKDYEEKRLFVYQNGNE